MISVSFAVPRQGRVERILVRVGSRGQDRGHLRDIGRVDAVDEHLLRPVRVAQHRIEPFGMPHDDDTGLVHRDRFSLDVQVWGRLCRSSSERVAIRKITRANRP